MFRKPITFAFFLSAFLPLCVYAVEDNPAACDCNTIIVSSEEEENGCPARVKRETCELFRESEQWKKTLKKEQELREMEKRMDPGRSSAIPR